VFMSLALVSFSLLMFSTRSFIINIRDTGLSVYSGVRGGIHSVTSFFTGSINSFRELLVLRKNYEELSGSLERYRQLERSAAEIRAENYRLREQLGFSQVLQYRHVAAEIIGRDPDNLFPALVINKGTKHGVKKNMPVIAYQNGMQALVGRVIQAGYVESLVLPLYDSRSFIASRLSQSRAECLIKGAGAADRPLIIQSVDKRTGERIGPGDLLVTSVTGGIYPGEIIIGRVSRVTLREGSSSFDVEVSPAADFASLEYVFVIEKENGGGNEGGD